MCSKLPTVKALFITGKYKYLGYNCKISHSYYITISHDVISNPYLVGIPVSTDVQNILTTQKLCNLVAEYEKSGGGITPPVVHVLSLVFWQVI